MRRSGQVHAASLSAFGMAGGRRTDGTDLKDLSNLPVISDAFCEVFAGSTRVPVGIYCLLYK